MVERRLVRSGEFVSPHGACGGSGFATSGESGQGYARYIVQRPVRSCPAAAVCVIYSAKSPGAALGVAPIAAYMLQCNAVAYVASGGSCRTSASSRRAASAAGLTSAQRRAAASGAHPRRLPPITPQRAHRIPPMRPHHSAERTTKSRHGSTPQGAVRNPTRTLISSGGRTRAHGPATVRARYIAPRHHADAQEQRLSHAARRTARRVAWRRASMPENTSAGR
jgi:hypothetical protein